MILARAILVTRDFSRDTLTYLPMCFYASARALARVQFMLVFVFVLDPYGLVFVLVLVFVFVPCSC